MNKHNLQKSHSFERTTHNHSFGINDGNSEEFQLEGRGIEDTETDQVLMQELEEKTKKIEEELSIEHSKLTVAHSQLSKNHNSLQSDFQSILSENVAFYFIHFLFMKTAGYI